MPILPDESYLAPRAEAYGSVRAGRAPFVDGLLENTEPRQVAKPAAGQYKSVLRLRDSLRRTGSGSLETSTFLGSKGSNQAVHRAKCWQVAPCVRPVAMISGL